MSLSTSTSSSTITDQKLGPPENLKSREYHPVLQTLEHTANEQCIQEYIHDIYQAMSKTETQNNTLNCEMIDLQPEVAWYMRPALLDFLVDVHNSLRLQHETLFLTMFILDNYCARRVVFKKHYQLVGCTALWIASKYEDKKSRVPTLKELTLMCRHTFDPDMFVQMEMHILSTLDWNLSHTSLEDCLQICLRNSSRFIAETPRKLNGKLVNKQEMNRQIEQLSRYFLELTLYERNFIQFPNSLTAITCHLLASNLLSSTSAINSFETSITQFYEQQQQEFSHCGAHGNEGEDCIVNDENQDPMSNVIAPFFSGWNEDESIDSIFKILILLVFQLVNIDEVTQVLPGKYPEFQPLLHSFVNDNKVLLSYVDVHSSQLDNSSAFKLNHTQSQACQRLIGLPTDDDDDDEEEDHMQYQDNCEALQSYDLYSNYPSAEFSRPKLGSNSNSLPLTPASAHSAVFSDAPTYTSSYSSSPTIPQYPSQPQASNKSIFFQQSNNLIPTPVEPTFKNPNYHLPQTGTFIKQMQHQQQQQQLSDVSANEESDYDEEMPNSSPLASKSRQSAYQSGRMTSGF